MKFSLFFILVAILTLQARANECAAEREEFCSQVEPGKGQLMRCLNENKDQLGSKCQSALKEFVAKTKKSNPCFEELAENCSEMTSGRDRLTLCLIKNEKILGDSCRKDLTSKKDKFYASEPCADDLIDKCYSELTQPEGMAIRCLIKNKGKLKARCETAMNAKIQKMRATIPCFDDTEKFCPGTVNRGEIDKCLEKHKSKLAKNCQRYIEREIAIVKKNPCHQDIKNHCRPNLSDPQKFRCLELNEDKISNACLQIRKVKKDKIKKMEEVCESDRQKLCAKEQHANGMIVKCLRSNKAKVSKECAKLL
ncbi:MAG: cysteine rich repeat-containing protein [Bacteriovoracaceae bacterium]|nr:cysteine rich repeat-containing protein [Bacteriovoracaceae bacterium]